LQFSPSKTHSVGVEWELQLLDSVSLDLADGIIPLMEFFPDANHIKPENIQSCVEITSCIADNSDQAVAHIGHSLQALLQRCDELEMGVCGGGTHPFCRRLALITPLPRYQQGESKMGYLAHTQITFSTHVHVGMASGDQAIRAMSLLIPVLPAFIALSANSPFWRGHETGHAAYRHRILAAAPNYGLPPRFDNWCAFDKFYEAATRSGMIRSIKDIHWDIRPHPDFGTLEIRVMDSASDLRTVHGLVAFTRSIILSLINASTNDIDQVLPQNLPHWVDRENRFRAGRLGLDAEFIVDGDGRHRPLRDLVTELMAFCEPSAANIGESRGLAIAASLLNDSPAHVRQIKAFRESNSARSAVKVLRDALIAAR